jgi:hypothetical protein
MAESLSVPLGRADIEGKMFEGMCEGRLLPCRQMEWSTRDGGGWKAGGNAGRCRGGVGCGDGRLHMVVLYNGAMEFKMTRTSIGLNDGSQEESNIAPICLV